MKPKLHTITSGYFPNAMRAIALHAQYGNDKHNPGEPLHWAYNKSTEHAESAARHLAQAGDIDDETGKSHTIGLAMRALMLLETELIRAGAMPGWAVKFNPVPNSFAEQVLDGLRAAVGVRDPDGHIVRGRE